MYIVLPLAVTVVIRFPSCLGKRVAQGCKSSSNPISSYPCVPSGISRESVPMRNEDTS
jgi:hypothetical protein